MGCHLPNRPQSANAHDLVSALTTVVSLLVGRRRRRPKRLGTDAGYGSIEFRRELRSRGIKPAIGHREYEHRHDPERLWNDSGERRYSTKRWRVEQRIACLDQNRRLDFMYERPRDAYEAFLTFARIRTYLKVLKRCRT